MNFFTLSPIARYGWRLFVISISLYLVSCQSSIESSTPINAALYESITQKRLLLPNGWHITEVGATLPLADLPLNLISTPDKKHLFALNCGHGAQMVHTIDITNQQITDMDTLAKSWLGIAVHPDREEVYTSGGNDNRIYIFDMSEHQLSLKDSVVLGASYPEEKILVAGMEVDRNGQWLYAVSREDSALYVIDIEARSVEKRIPLPHEPYTCLLSPNKEELYVSYWTGGSVGTIGTTDHQLQPEIPVGSNPNDLKTTEDGAYLFVANANDNSVSVISTETRKVIETIGTALYPDAPTGSTTNGLALSEDNNTLFIANADNNCVAVFDISEKGESRSLGFIPTGWYPTDVEVVGNQLFVSNGKGSKGKIGNPEGPQAGIPTKNREQYIGRLYKGSLSMIDIPDEETLATYSRIVYENTPYTKEREMLTEGEADHPIPAKVGDPSPIKYVFYFVKENRTYDQMFGDMPEGNGDSSLCLFPEQISPNHHQLAREFVLLDNFYVDAEVSQDGHNWSSGAYATDYVEKQWPTTYSGRGGSFNYYSEGSHPKEGYIWDYCDRAGVSWRNYGMFVRSYGDMAFQEGIRGEVGIPSVEKHSYLGYPGYNLDFLDIDRMALWATDFDSLVAADALPQFHSIRIGNDHTYGARVGKRTPRAMVADNDLALGRFVEHISKSPIWKESAIFVLEDDAQNGPDHVDAHRSIALVISPYTKRKEVISEMYTTSSMLRTMELILGLPPMSQYDAGATPMWACFTSTADMTPYTALPAQIDLDERNQEDNEIAKISESFDWSEVDRAPDHAFSQVIWKAVKGIDSEMPAPRRSAFIKVLEEEEETEE